MAFLRIAAAVQHLLDGRNVGGAPVVAHHVFVQHDPLEALLRRLRPPQLVRAVRRPCSSVQRAVDFDGGKQTVSRDGGFHTKSQDLLQLVPLIRSALQQQRGSTSCSRVDVFDFEI